MQSYTFFTKNKMFFVIYKHSARVARAPPRGLRRSKNSTRRFRVASIFLRRHPPFGLSLFICKLFPTPVGIEFPQGKKICKLAQSRQPTLTVNRIQNE